MNKRDVQPGPPAAVMNVLDPGSPGSRVVTLPPRMAGWSLKAGSHRGGRVRNEDRVGAWCSESSALLALADGMGGHPEGDVAAEMAVRRLGRRFVEEACPELGSPRTFLPAAFLDAHDELIDYGCSLGGPDQPRTTLVAALVQRGQLWWSHCGDSRLYLVRGRAVLARTRDHSYVELNALLADGSVPAPATSRHVLFSCIGSPGRPLVDSAGPLDLQRGDRLLLCSDGLWEGLGDEVIVDELSKDDLDAAVGVLAERALMAGGARCDNVTLLALAWDVEIDGVTQTASPRGAQPTHE